MRDQVKHLIKQLKSSDPDIREDAAKRLGELRDRRAVLPLMQGLKDREHRVQIAAAEALGQIGDARAEEALIHCLKGETYGLIRHEGAPHLYEKIMESAAVALGKIGGISGTEALLSQAGAEDPYRVEAAAAGLGYSQDVRALPAIIGLLLNHPFSFVRRQSAIALGQQGGTQAVEVLIKTLRDPDYSVRLSAVEVLGKLKDVRAAVPLREFFRNVKVFVQGATTDRGSQPRMRIRLLSEVTTALALIGDLESLKLLESNLHSVDWELQVVAAVGLARRKDERVFDTLARVVREDCKSDMAIEAVKALGHLGDRRAITLLTPIAQAHDIPLSTVNAASRALEQIREGRIEHIMWPMLEEEETAPDQQTYTREASREYAPIVELVKQLTTRDLGCAAFAEFRQQYPDYDPEDIAAICEKRSLDRPKARHLRVSDLLPLPFEWVDIPAGRVELEGGHGAFDVPAFQIAKYPLTNAQYAKFIEAGGYREKQWWTAAGWEVCEQGWEENWHQKNIMEPTGKAWTEPCYWRDAKWNGAEYPVVGVSWYEAVAFCRWLSDVSGEPVTLPTEQQWQRAAQGNDGRVYPWGNEWDGVRCNNSIRLISRQTAPVTQYPDGASPFGIMDMSGNVFEWCLNDYHDPRHVDLDTQAEYRVSRGGSWNCGSTVLFRALNRHLINPLMRGHSLGFRCARSVL